MGMRYQTNLTPIYKYNGPEAKFYSISGAVGLKYQKQKINNQVR